MVAVVLNTLEDAEALFRRLVEGLAPKEIESIAVGDWVNSHVRLDMGLHSEITPPFMEAFLETQNAIYRLAALVKYDAADIRRLTQEDLDNFQILVKVEEGSSKIFGEIADAIGKIGEAAVGKMTGPQIIAMISILAILVAGNTGFSTYLEHRKEVRKDEIQHEERVKALDGLEFANKQTVELAKEALAFARAQGGVTAKAADTANNINGALLRAASETPESEIDGHHLTRAEAKELRSSARRPVLRMIVEREMRVIDINTADQAHTTVVVEDADGRAQYRLQFADRLIQERDQERLFQSLKERATVWLRMDVKDVGGQISIVNIRGVVDAPEEVRFAEAD